jgi:hypothetical protein
MNNHYGFATKWNDTNAINNLEQRSDVRVISLLNVLEDLSLMFERSPSKIILNQWATKLDEMNISKSYLSDKCKQVPRTFDKFPSFKELSEILGVHQFKTEEKEKSKKEIEWINRIDEHKKRFIDTLGKEKLELFCKYFVRNVFNLTKDSMMFERLVIDCWAFLGFKDAKTTIENAHIYLAYLENKRGSLV